MRPLPLVARAMLFFRWISSLSRVSAFPLMRQKSSAGTRCAAPTKQPFASCRRVAWLTAGFLALGSSPSAIPCQDGDEKGNGKSGLIETPPFDDSMLTYDHYNGVTLQLNKLDEGANNDRDTFQKRLEQALKFWEAEGRKGIWIHATSDQSHLIPCCVGLGFSFHFVKNGQLILSRWLPQDTPSKLPLGPTHQVGVGTLVLHPSDPSLMLVVQEKTGPAAAYKLWKMPTGLLDPGEDIPDAAARELKEETGLEGKMIGIVCFRQAHSPARSSDLFFVCQMSLANADSASNWHPQEDEIVDIQWMSVEDYCSQDLWQDSPVYESLNDSIRKASLSAHRRNALDPSGMIIHQQLPLGFGRGTNALFKSQL